MKKRYAVYRLYVEMPMLKDTIKPGCTLGRDENGIKDELKIFDTIEEAEDELKRRTSVVYPRFQCRKSCYDVNEWRMDEIFMDDSGNIEKSSTISFASMDMSYLEEENDYMP